MKKKNPFFDLKWLSLAIVGAVLVLLVFGGLIRAVKDGSGLDPGTASAAFALLGAMVAGSLGSVAATGNAIKEKEEEPTDIDPEDY
jgi:hypothetical protein